MAEKKTTKKEYLAILRSIVENAERTDKDALVDFINHEIELLEKKKSSGSKKNDAEHREVMDKIITALAEIGRPVTITEMQNECAEIAPSVYSNQKISRMLKKLVEDEQTVVRTMDKKKAYFSLAE